VYSLIFLFLRKPFFTIAVWTLFVYYFIFFIFSNAFNCGSI